MMIAAAPYQMIQNPATMMEYIEPKRRREKFLPEEDEQLRELVDKYGINSWDTIAECMPGRNARQCRERWKHYLSSNRGKAPWTEEEDKLLLEKMEELGPKWTKIATFFEDRTDIQIKTRWMQKFASFSNLHLKNRSKNHPMIYAAQQLNPAICLQPPQFIPGMIPSSFQQPQQPQTLKPNVTFVQPIQPPIKLANNTPNQTVEKINPKQQVELQPIQPAWAPIEHQQRHFQTVQFDQNALQKRNVPSPRLPIPQSDEELYDTTDFSHGSQNFWENYV
ncbi:hypothetical protein M9Y10_011741 [Tritrichomonas musculus]|uniref:Myb-like DNA-binding domain containing protein n=1 Tax=Tritrichomonas musculus TaxID=1915356 RepID=A0ABR2IK31_9EUKA